LLSVPAGLLSAGAVLGVALSFWLFAKATCQGREDWRRFVAAEIGFSGAMIVLLCALMLLFGAQWWAAVLIFLGAYLVGSMPAWSTLRMAHGASGRRLAAASSWHAASAVAAYARFSLLTGGANTIFAYSDRFAAQHVLGFAEVGVYQVYNSATIGVAVLLLTMLYNFVFPLFAQGDRRAFAALFRSGFLRLLPLTLTALFVGGWIQIHLTGFPFRPSLLALATVCAAASIVAGFYGHLVSSLGVSGVQLSSRVAFATLALFALGVVPAVRLGGLGGIFALYTLINLGIGVVYDRALRRLEPDAAAETTVTPQL